MAAGAGSGAFAAEDFIAIRAFYNLLRFGEGVAIGANGVCMPDFRVFFIIPCGGEIAQHATDHPLFRILVAGVFIFADMGLDPGARPADEPAADCTIAYAI